MRPFCSAKISITISFLMAFCPVNRSTFASIGDVNEDSKASGKTADSTLIIDAERLELVYYRAALMTLIKGKAKRLLVDLPPTEATVFAQCEREADTPAHLAKCVAVLLTARDSKRFVVRPSLDRFIGDGTGDWYGWIVGRMWQPYFLNKLAHQLMNSVTDKSNNNEIGKNGSIRAKDGEYNFIKIQENDENVTNEKNNQNKTQKKAKKLDSVKLERLAKALRKELQRENATRSSKALLKRLSASRAFKFNAAAIRRRRKRRIELKSLATACYVQKLRELNDFYVEMRNYTEFIDKMNDKNNRFLAEFDVPLGLSVARFRRSALLDAADERLRRFALSNYRILSPKLFALVPEQSNRADKTQSAEISPATLLSPSLLSFHEDSPLSLPSILTMSILPDREKDAWLELLIDMSGAGRVLDRLLTQLRPKMHDVRTRFFPAVQLLRDLHMRFERFRSSQSDEQRHDLQRFGYAIADAAQANDLHRHDDPELSRMSAEDVEAVLEEDIRQLASMADFTDSNTNASASRTRRSILVNKFGDVRVMNPFFFKHQMHEGALLRRVILSPRAFGAIMTSPDFYGITVLSPNAFVPRILSPRALYASILSPYAFGGNLLSPQAATADVLSPRALFMNILSPRFANAAVLSPRMLMAEVLSPKAVEIDVLSSIALSFTVLSPSTLSTKIGSPPVYVLSILSPGVMNANFQSKGFMNIQVLSPSILTYDN